MNLNIPGFDKEKLLAHIDSNNPNTFEVEDLARLIHQVGRLTVLNASRAAALQRARDCQTGLNR